MKPTGILLVVSALTAALPLRAVDAYQEGKFSDEEIVGIIDAANQGELDAAALASTESKNEDVLAFARHMTKDHTDAKRGLEDVEGKATLAPSSTDLSEDLRQQASDETTRLKGLEGEAFDRAYVDAQVSAHAALLRELDQDLIPDAKDHALAALLRKLRPTVAHHLALARKLQAEFGGGTP